MSPVPESAAAPLAEAPAIPALLDDGEAVLLAVRPSGWFVVLVSWPVLLVAALLAGAAQAAGEETWPWLPRHAVEWLAAALALGRLAAACFQWLGRLYLLTDRRVMWIHGLIRFQVRQCPLRKVRRLALSAGRGERLLGLGSLLMAADQTPALEPWVNLARPGQVRQAVERAVLRAGGRLEQ